MKPTQTLDSPEVKLNQVEIDHIELDSTSVTPATARFLSWAFVAMLFAVPLSQTVVELSKSKAPQVFDLFTPFARGVKQATVGDWKNAWAAWGDSVRPETLHAYEAALEGNSALKGFFQPRIQEILTGVFKAGNEKVVLGSNGWLYYQTGLEYVSRASIIDPATLDLATKKMVDKALESSPNPDPRPALLQLHRDCLKAGIRLVVLPLPDKVMLQSAQLRGRIAPSGEAPIPNNSGYARLVAELRAQGVDWFDPTPGRAHADEIRYLIQDTHWTPEFMTTVAKGLAGHIRQSGSLPVTSPLAFRIVEQQVSRVGDLVDSLKLTPQQTIFAPQTVTIQKVIDERSGRPVEPDGKADVLLLGDSFTNIYSQPDIGWGAGAGFAEHLAFHLKRTVDVIAFNGGGASRVRAELARLDNAERLGHKKVIVYEFAIRNLLGENWKLASMVSPVRPVTAAKVPAPPEVLSATKVAPKTPRAEAVKESENPAQAAPVPIKLVVRVMQTSKVPAAGTAPYKDCLTFLKVHVESIESGSYKGSEMIAVFWAMKDNQWLPAATYAVGDFLRLTAIPFSQASPQIRGMQRADDTEDFTLRPHFVIQGERQ